MPSRQALSVWAQDIQRFAEARRKVKAFSPTHPAVRAAKRWCERTGATWEIGVGGRCELGKRAIKQWLYEWTLPLRQMRNVLAIVAVVFTALIVAGLIWQTIPSLVILAIIGNIVGMGVGGMTADSHINHEPLFSDMSRPQQIAWIAIWVLFLPGAGVMYLMWRIGNSGFMRRNGERIAVTFLFILLAAFCFIIVFGLVESIITYGWLRVLRIVGLVLLGVATLFGIVFGLPILINTRLEKRAEIKLQAVRNDATAQQRALELCTPALMEYYADGRYRPQPLSYDEWRDRLKDLLNDQGMNWSDLIAPHPYMELMFISNDRAFGVLGYLDFINALDALYDKSQTPTARRARKVAEGVSFTAATLFLVKAKFCPNVILPPKDMVEA